MARYNTAPQTLEVTGAETFSYAFTGGIISLTGTAGYTVTLVSPVFFPGSRQTFYNATDGSITLATPAGQFTGNGVTLGTDIEIPTNSTYQITSDGTNYVLTSALAGTTVFELPLITNDLLDANGKVELNPLDNNVEIKPTGTGLVDISPQSSVSIQPGGQATIRPTGNLLLTSASGTVTLGDAGQSTSFPGNISFTQSGQTVNISPTGTGAGAGSVTIDPTGNTTIGAGGTLTISSDTLGSISNMRIGATNPAQANFTSLGATGAVTFTANTASSSTTSGTLVVTGGLGVSGAIYAGSLQSTPIGSTTRSTGAFTTLTANGATTLTANTAATNTTTGTLVVTGGIGASGAIYAGSIQNTPIGNSTRNTGAFTTLAANSTVDFTATTEATSSTVGAVQIDGGVAVAKRVYAGGGFQGAIGNVTRSTGQFTTLDANSTVTFSPSNANVTISPSGTGTVTMSPAGGGSINNMSIGATTRSTGQFTTLNTNSTYTASGIIDCTNTTEATDTSGDTGAIRTEGGISAAKRIYAGGGLQNTPIGSVTRNTGAFTTLTANSTVTVTATTASTSVNSGALQVDGGVGINGAVYIGGLLVPQGGTQGIIGYTPQNSTATLADVDRKYIVSNTAAITLTLPNSSTDGRTIVIVDGNNFGSFNCTVGRNSRTIGGLSENLVLNVQGSKVEFVYRGGDWKVFAI